MTTTTLQRPTQRTDRDWLITVEDDQMYGYHWFATRLGVLIAKGWARTRSESTAIVIARQTSAAVYAAHILDPQETK